MSSIAEAYQEGGKVRVLTALRDRAIEAVDDPRTTSGDRLKYMNLVLKLSEDIQKLVYAENDPFSRLELSPEVAAAAAELAWSSADGLAWPLEGQNRA